MDFRCFGGILEQNNFGGGEMYNPYNEQVCKGCPFAGRIFEAPIGTNSIKYIECKRDNVDSQEHFKRTNANESILSWIQQTNFLHCLFANENK